MPPGGCAAPPAHCFICAADEFGDFTCAPDPPPLVPAHSGDAARTGRAPATPSGDDGSGGDTPPGSGGERPRDGCISSGDGERDRRAPASCSRLNASPKRARPGWLLACSGVTAPSAGKRPGGDTRPGRVSGGDELVPDKLRRLRTPDGPFGTSGL